MASGSEVSVTLKAAEALEADGIKTRVVSFPSWELFEMQPDSYKESVLPAAVKARVSVEAGVKQGWGKYIGDKGNAVSIEIFGHSAPVEVLMDKYGFSAGNISSVAKKVLAGLK